MRAKWVAPAALIAVFVVHRVLVILSAGDFLHPIEPSEAKNAQIAWDLMTGRFGTEGFGLAAYVSNSGSVHHAAYSSTALVYLLVNKVLGWGILGIRAVPLLFQTAALGVLAWALLRTVGAAAASLAILGSILVPTVFMGHQVTFQGSHPESVLPLALAMAAWLVFTAAPDRGSAFFLGLAFGYAAIFNYLLIPPVALMTALLLVPPRPRLDRHRVKAAAIGAAIGLWPLWLILLLEPTALSHSITEMPHTTVAHQASGGDASLDLLWRTWWENLPYGFDDVWMHEGRTGGLWGSRGFEIASYRTMIFGPLLLLPFALATRRPQVRRLALFVALMPVLTYAGLVWSTPFKPYVPSRYLIGTLFVAWTAPALLVGIGLEGLDGRGRLAGGIAVALGLAWFAWQAPPRLVEAADAVRLERSEANLEHRYVTYYNLGIGTIWASQVDAVNRLIDVRAAEDDPHAFDGIQAGLWMLGSRRGLGIGHWEPTPIDWPFLRASMGEWQETESYASDEERARPERSAENIGWGITIRLQGDLPAIVTLLEEARRSGEWPKELPLEAAWRGVGEGLYGQEPALLAVPEAFRPAVEQGLRQAAERGEVPPARLPINARTVRGTAT